MSVTTGDQFEAARAGGRSLKIPVDGIECVDPPYNYDRALAGLDGVPPGRSPKNASPDLSKAAEPSRSRAVRHPAQSLGNPTVSS